MGNIIFDILTYRLDFLVQEPQKKHLLFFVTPSCAEQITFNISKVLTASLTPDYGANKHPLHPIRYGGLGIQPF